MPNAFRPRIAVVFNGDVQDRTAWSGTPYGVFSGLEAIGAEPVPVDSRPTPRVHQALGVIDGLRRVGRVPGSDTRGRMRAAYSAALIGPLAARAQSAAVAVKLRRVGHLDAIVQIGTGFSLPGIAPIVTYEDMTIRQALAYPYAQWGGLSTQEIEMRLERQQRCYEAATACCTTNSWAAWSVERDYGIPASRVHVVGVGSHEAPRVVARDWSTPRYLFVGLDWKRKNGPRVLDAFRLVRETHPDARLDVVGGHPPLDAPGVVGHGRLRRDVAADRDTLRGLFDQATCFVMPSLFEPSAVVYTEALACGLPSVGTNVGGSEDLIGDAGLVVNPSDGQAIFRAMHELAGSEAAQALSRRAYDRAPAFTWKAVAERLVGSVDPGLLGRPLAAALPRRGLEHLPGKA